MEHEPSASVVSGYFLFVCVCVVVKDGCCVNTLVSLAKRKWHAIPPVILQQNAHFQRICFLWFFGKNDILPSHDLQNNILSFCTNELTCILYVLINERFEIVVK